MLLEVLRIAYFFHPQLRVGSLSCALSVHRRCSQACLCSIGFILQESILPGDSMEQSFPRPPEVVSLKQHLNLFAD